MIKTRFAPSPTGELHIGGARTALFSYLFAKNKRGEFLLRIEDTDRERYVEGSIERIIKSLNWLGIKADNIDKPVIQSKRLEVYKKHAFDLVRAGKAYICTCGKEKLATDREKQEKAHKPSRYEGHCRTADLKLSDMKEGCYTIRMKMPESGKIIVDDLIHGKVEFDASLLDDQIILKSDGYPTYHLASVIDDNEMGITHVIRSDEWLSSTPKHIELYKMFGWDAPKFAHLSMILGPDKKKLSKRHGATGVIDYQNEGYLPEALVNFIAFLGWNPKDEREVFSIDELIHEFSLDKVNKSSAIFDIEKLNSINQHYLKSQISNLSDDSEMSESRPKRRDKSTTENLKNILIPFGVENLKAGEAKMIGRGGYKTLKEAAEYIKKLRQEPKYEASLLIFKKSDKEKTTRGLKGVQGKIQGVEQWKTEELQKMLENVVLEEKLTNGDVFWPVRVALSGEEKSPSPIELMLALGKEKSIERIEKAIEKLR